MNLFKVCHMDLHRLRSSELARLVVTQQIPAHVLLRDREVLHRLLEEDAGRDAFARLVASNPMAQEYVLKNPSLGRIRIGSSSLAGLAVHQSQGAALEAIHNPEIMQIPDVSVRALRWPAAQDAMFRNSGILRSLPPAALEQMRSHLPELLVKNAKEILNHPDLAAFDRFGGTPLAEHLIERDPEARKYAETRPDLARFLKPTPGQEEAQQEEPEQEVLPDSQEISLKTAPLSEEQLRPKFQEPEKAPDPFDGINNIPFLRDSAAPQKTPEYLSQPEPETPQQPVPTPSSMEEKATLDPVTVNAGSAMDEQSLGVPDARRALRMGRVFKLLTEDAFTQDQRPEADQRRDARLQRVINALDQDGIEVEVETREVEVASTAPTDPEPPKSRLL